MSTITNSAQLKALIQQKEIENKDEGKKLKEDFLLTYENLKPLNIIKNSLKKVFQSNEVQSDLVSSAISMAANYAASKLEPKQPTKSSLSTLSQMALSAIANNPETVKSVGSQLIDLIFRKNKSATK
jgi:hypothetical protein